MSIHNNNGVKLVRRQRCGRVLRKKHPFTLAMPPQQQMTILTICTVLCIFITCAGGVCKLVHHHIPNTKLTRDNIIASRIAIAHRHMPEAAAEPIKKWYGNRGHTCWGGGGSSLPHYTSPDPRFTYRTNTVPVRRDCRCVSVL